MKNRNKKIKMIKKRGFTRLELSIVLFLMAVIVTMTVSFSKLVGKYTNINNTEYEFLVQCSDLKTDITKYVYENTSITLEDLNEQNFAKNYSEIESVTFSNNGSLLKSVVKSVTGKEQTFVVYLRVQEVTNGE